jgi:polygalacturonase
MGKYVSNSMRRLFTACLLTCCCIAEATVYDVRNYGAVGDGRHIDSPAINAAIEQAATDGEGDAVVVLRGGTFLCYSVHLRSGITLRIEQDAVLKAAPPTNTQGYDEAEPRNDTLYQDFGHSHWHNSLIWGEGLHDVTLEGGGLIDGTDVLTRGRQHKTTAGQTIANKALALRDCQRVTIRELSFSRCGHFAMLLTGVDDLLIDQVTADTNRDGFDIDCCQRVTIRGCRVNTVNDDAIVLKCSYALGCAKPTEHVLVEDCHVSGYDVGTLLDDTRTTHTLKAPDGDGPTGRIKLGTESNGGFRHIEIRNCTFTHCRGLALETVDGAPMEHINVHHIRMTDICNSPIYIRLGNRMRAPKGFRHSTARDILISHIDVDGADSRYACLIVGAKGNRIRHVCLSDMRIRFQGGLTLEDVKAQRGSNPFFYSDTGQAAINRHWEKEGYPEPSAHGIQPAWGLSVSYAEDLRLEDIHLETIRHDERKAVFTRGCRKVRMKRVTTINKDDE